MKRRAVEIACFTSLAWFSAAHWADGLVARAPSGRVLACVVIATAVAVTLSLLADARGLHTVVLRGACVLAGLGAGAVAVGLERRLLAPAHWDELGDGLDRGFAALASVEWPYDGPEPWTRLVLLLAIPLVLATAAALAFSTRRSLRPVALVLLVAFYGVAVTNHQFGGELARGALLLALIAAWLWLPELSARGWRAAAFAGGAVLVACTAALPAAARYDDRAAWVDYRSWNPFAGRVIARFDWSHTYGPIDWPRDGRTLMTVRSAKPHYWRLETLDHFNGVRWLRAGFGRGGPPRRPTPSRDRWLSRFRVTIRDLDTALVPAAGTPLEITGGEFLARVTSDGTVEGIGESLGPGDAYYVRAYVPDPTPEEMRAAPDAVPGAISAANTGVFLPPVAEPQLPATDAEIEQSPYARVLRLARRLARGQPTRYDVVRAVARHLRSTYDYNEQPPDREFPLAAFLFDDRIGYCQQFSGAMALILRMLDIPARVAAGFAPGSYNRDTGDYRVRDLDAHSWVEVWFTGIGWVPFDPTPSVAPADSQSPANAASAAAGALGEAPDQRRPELDRRARDPAGDRGAAGGRGAPLARILIIAWAPILLGFGGLAALSVQARRRWAHLPPEEVGIAELRDALARLGEPVPPRLTLRQLEPRLQRRAGVAAGRYVRMLRARRYALAGRAPDAAARSELRRALARGRGPRAWLAALVALPPLSFRRG